MGLLQIRRQTLDPVAGEGIRRCRYRRASAAFSAAVVLGGKRVEALSARYIPQDYQGITALHQLLDESGVEDGGLRRGIGCGRRVGGSLAAGGRAIGGFAIADVVTGGFAAGGFAAGGFAAGGFAAGGFAIGGFVIANRSGAGRTTAALPCAGETEGVACWFAIETDGVLGAGGALATGAATGGWGAACVTETGPGCGDSGAAALPAAG